VGFVNFSIRAGLLYRQRVRNYTFTRMKISPKSDIMVATMRGTASLVGKQNVCKKFYLIQGYEV